MDRVAKALENHHKGYNCAQAVVCAFADVTDFTEDELFRQLPLCMSVKADFLLLFVLFLHKLFS